MDIKILTPDFAVSPQLLPHDMAGLAALGFRSVICNRPDGEADGQPDFASVKAAAQLAGLRAIYLPLVPGQLDSDLVGAFGAALADLPDPVLAYCRSGTRSATLWSLAMSGTLPRDEIIQTAGRAGYDVSAAMAVHAAPDIG